MTSLITQKRVQEGRALRYMLGNVNLEPHTIQAEGWVKTSQNKKAKCLSMKLGKDSDSEFLRVKQRFCD